MFEQQFKLNFSHLPEIFYGDVNKISNVYAEIMSIDDCLDVVTFLHLNSKIDSKFVNNVSYEVHFFEPFISIFLSCNTFPQMEEIFQEFVKF